MKIAFFIGSMARGGAERVISILANHYVRKGWKVEIILLLKNKVEYDLSDQVKVIDMSGLSNSYFKNAGIWLKRIRSYLGSEKPDCVVSFVARINALVLTASIGLKTKIIVSERNDPRHDGRSNAMQAYCDLIYRRSAGIVFQTEYERSCFSDKVQKMGIVIPNPVSVTAMPQRGGQTLKIITAGRLAEQKNQKILIEAVDKIKENFQNLECYIYGEGPLEQFLKGEIDKKGLNKVVFLPGNVKNIYEKVSEASVFVMTSDYEGLSNSLIEAMMIGVPCITTDYPGARELIVDNENGKVVPCNDANALAKALIEMLSDTTQAQKYARAAEMSAREYSAEVVLNKWDNFIEAVIIR